MLYGFIMSIAITAAVFNGPAPVPQTAPGPYYRLQESDHEGCHTFDSKEPVVGTSYFYWYDSARGEHTIDPDGSDALTTHPIDMDLLSYRNPAWHRQQLEDMMDAGIDFLMPVYWGIPGQYSDSEMAWSFIGIPPLVEAWRAIEEEGALPPRIGLFLDTSILTHNLLLEDRGNYQVDLTTNWGKDFFYASIRDYFSMLPPDLWARIEGHPIVFLYSASFALRQDPDVFEYVYTRFEKDFAVRPFIVKMRDWEGDADATYMWKGAEALLIDQHVAALGPGYDDSNVYGRIPTVLERRDGETYREVWEHVLMLNPDSRPWIVHVETWNEWHEGADVAHSRQYGRKYIDMTRKYADMFRNKVMLPRTGPYSDAEVVSWTVDNPDGLYPHLHPGDGMYEFITIEDTQAIVTCENERANAPYMYFKVDNSFLFDASDTTAVLHITYLDSGCEAFMVEYDNTNPDMGVLEGAFRPSEVIQIERTETWRTVQVLLPDVRFIGRCNSADFRLSPGGGEMTLAISKLEMRIESSHVHIEE